MGGRCCSNGLCCLFGILSVIAGLIAYYFAGFLINFFVLAWIVLGGALLFLILFLAIILFAYSAENSEITCCVCKNYVCLLIGIVGAIIASIISILLFGCLDILVFFVVGFGVFMLLEMIALIGCLAGQLCD